MIAWYCDNSVELETIGKRTPDDFGLYDLSGNAWEWGWDGYGDYPSSGATDPAGADSSDKVIRGGSYKTPSDDCRSANRDFLDAGTAAEDVGFRVVRSLD